MDNGKTKQSAGELGEMITDFRKRIMSTYSLMGSPREKKENRGKLRREIARIETELSRMLMKMQKQKKDNNFIDLFIVLSSFGVFFSYIFGFIFVLNEVLPNPHLFTLITITILGVASSFGVLIVFAYWINYILKYKLKMSRPKGSRRRNELIK